MNDHTEQTPSRELVIAKQVAGHLQKMEPEYRAVLPAHIEPAEFTRIAQTAIQLNEDLQECSQRSLIASCTRLAEMGLRPDGKEAALVAFNVKVKRRNRETGLMVETWEKRATPMPMVEGLRMLVRQSGQVKNWKARVVRLGDFFEHVDGDEESLVHKPQHDIDQPITHVYSIAYLENGELARHVIPVAHVEKIRKRSKNGDKGPWVNDYAEMAIKTCMKQQAKYLPKAKDDLNRARFVGALRALDEADGFDTDQRQDVPRLSMQQATSQRLRQAIDAQVFEDEQDDRDADRAHDEIRRGPQYVETGPQNAGETQAPKAAPARKRRSTSERIAANLAEVNKPKEGNGKTAPAATPAPVSSTPQQPSEAKQSTSEPTAPAADASFDDDRFPGDIPSQETDGEDPEEMAYRDGWHVRGRGQTRMPPRSLNEAAHVQAWLEGWDSYDKSVKLGNGPQSAAASEAMLDQMVGQVFV